MKAMLLVKLLENGCYKKKLKKKQQQKTCVFDTDSCFASIWWLRICSVWFLFVWYLYVVKKKNHQ